MYTTCKIKIILKNFLETNWHQPFGRNLYLIAENTLKSIAKHNFLSSAFNFTIEFRRQEFFRKGPLKNGLKMVTRRQDILAYFTLPQSTHLEDQNETKMKKIGEL